ncbi:MAG: ATP synthase F1 subunit delta [Bacteroidales bacterium]
MNESKIAVRYSKALFLSASEQKKLKEVREDMVFVLRLSAMEDFRSIINSPVINNTKKREIMKALFKDNVSSTSFSLITLAVNNNREAYLPGIARVYIDRADRHEGITRVMLKTAAPVGSNNRDRVIGIIEEDLNTKADMEEIVDSDIAGGYILKIEDKYIDASLRTQLRKIKEELIKG